jgi:hypothetical protein
MFVMQFFLGPKVFSDGFIDCGIGISPINNVYRINFENGKQRLFFQVVFEALYILSVDLNETIFEHTLSFIPSLGLEFFLFRRLSIGYRLGFGFVIKLS